MRCPVCLFEIETHCTKCPNCQFDDFRSEFLSLEEYENWMLNCIVPRRDHFVRETLNFAKSCLDLNRKMTDEAEEKVKLGKKVSNSHFEKRSILSQWCDNCINAIDSIMVDWLLKGTITINYVEHMGFMDYCDDYIYSFDFTKESVLIKYYRRSLSQYEYGTYDNIHIKSHDFLRMLFDKHKIHKLEYQFDQDDILVEDGAWWEMNIQLRYPIIKESLSDESCWEYSERKEILNTDDAIKKWKWTSIDSDYVLESSGQLDYNQVLQSIKLAIGDYIKSPPLNLQVFKNKSEEDSDIW